MTKRSLISNTLFLSAFLILGRISGMIREISLARAFGVSAEADAAIVLLTLPDLMVAMLLAGGLGASLIPQMKRLDVPDQIVLFRKITLTVLILFSMIAVALTVDVSLFLRLFAPGLAATQPANFDTALLLVGLSIPIAAASGVFASFLNSRERFVVPAAGTLVFNGCLCFYFLFLANSVAGIFGVGVAVLVAVALRLLWKAIALRDTMTKVKASTSVPLSSIAPAFLNAMGATIVLVGIPILFRSVSSLEGPGAIAIFNYTLKIYELALLVLIAPLTTILLPYLSRLHAEKSQSFNTVLATGFNLTLIVTTTAVVAYFVTGLFFVRLLFSLANLPSQDTQEIYELGRYLFLAIPFFSLGQILSASQYATNASSRVLISSIVAAIITIGAYVGGVHAFLGFPIIAFITVFNLVYFVCLLALFDSKSILLSQLIKRTRLLSMVAAAVLLALLFIIGRELVHISFTLPMTCVIVAMIAYLFRGDIKKLKTF